MLVRQPQLGYAVLRLQNSAKNHTMACPYCFYLVQSFPAICRYILPKLPCLSLDFLVHWFKIWQITSRTDFSMMRNSASSMLSPLFLGEPYILKHTSRVPFLNPLSPNPSNISPKSKSSPPHPIFHHTPCSAQATVGISKVQHLPLAQMQSCTSTQTVKEATGINTAPTLFTTTHSVAQESQSLTLPKPLQRQGSLPSHAPPTMSVPSLEAYLNG